MKFTEKFFKLQFEAMREGQTYSNCAAEIVNAKLEEWLREAPMVYIDDQVIYGHKMRTISYVETRTSNAKARLVCVERLVNESKELQLLRRFVATFGSTVPPEYELITEARKLLEGK